MEMERNELIIKMEWMNELSGLSSRKISLPEKQQI